MRPRPLALPLAMLLFAVGCGAPSSGEAPSEPTIDARTVPTDPHEGLDPHDPAACESCHADVVGQWLESMHARAHHDRDPIYGAMRTLRMDKQGAQVGAKCAKCHNPLAPDDPDSAAGRAGVACGACHGSTAVVADLTDGRTVCLHCHEATKNPAGAAVCTTGPENQSMGGPSCTSCHMRASDGTLTHQFLGPHRAWTQDDPSFLAKALSVAMEREGDHVTVTASNASGHGFPTGFPGRVASLRLVAVDGGTPLAAPDELKWFKRYVDEEGEPTMPPFAAKLDLDTRMKPGETREVRVPVPPGTGSIRAELVFRLLPPPAAKALGLQEAPEAQPVVVLMATVDG